LSFLSRNTLSRKHDVGVLFTWAHSKILQINFKAQKLKTKTNTNPSPDPNRYSKRCYICCLMRDKSAWTLMLSYLSVLDKKWPLAVINCYEWNRCTITIIVICFYFVVFWYLFLFISSVLVTNKRTSYQGLPFEVVDRSLSLIDRLNTRQAIEFPIAY